MITHHCIIRNRKVVLNGKEVFAGSGGALDEFLIGCYHDLKVDYPKFYKMDNLSRLGWLGAEILIRESGLTNRYDPEGISVVLSNAHGSLDTDLRFDESTRAAASPALFVYTLPNIVQGEICIRHKLKGENAFFVSDQFDPELMATYVEIVNENNAGGKMAGASLAGWVDVLGEQHDVFLYLHEKKSTVGVPHSSRNLKALYDAYGTIDG